MWIFDARVCVCALFVDAVWLFRFYMQNMVWLPFHSMFAYYNVNQFILVQFSFFPVVIIIIVVDVAIFKLKSVYLFFWEEEKSHKFALRLPVRTVNDWNMIMNRLNAIEMCIQINYITRHLKMCIYNAKIISDFFSLSPPFASLIQWSFFCFCSSSPIRVD